jgi:putative Ca2+/H+ antiporter (TMEM165/GDT1 family)
MFMEALIQSFGLVLASEMGDKTQLLALVLAIRFKKPIIVMLGILSATILNHGLAPFLGGWLASLVSETTLHISLSIIFFAFALWILIPDKLEDDSTDKVNHATHAFFTTLVLFFLAEMGDKTQLATVALGAKFQAPISVTIGTTLGMLVADGLAVVFGERILKIIPMKIIRILSALLFAAFGGLILLQLK